MNLLRLTAGRVRVLTSALCLMVLCASGSAQLPWLRKAKNGDPKAPGSTEKPTLTGLVSEGLKLLEEGDSETIPETDVAAAIALHGSAAVSAHLLAAPFVDSSGQRLTRLGPHVFKYGDGAPNRQVLADDGTVLMLGRPLSEYQPGKPGRPGADVWVRWTDAGVHIASVGLQGQIAEGPIRVQKVDPSNHGHDTLLIGGLGAGPERVVLRRGDMMPGHPGHYVSEIPNVTASSQYGQALVGVGAGSQAHGFRPRWVMALPSGTVLSDRQVMLALGLENFDSLLNPQLPTWIFTPSGVFFAHSFEWDELGHGRSGGAFVSKGPPMLLRNDGTWEAKAWESAEYQSLAAAGVDIWRVIGQNFDGFDHHPQSVPWALGTVFFNRAGLDRDVLAFDDAGHLRRFETDDSDGGFMAGEQRFAWDAVTLGPDGNLLGIAKEASLAVQSSTPRGRRGGRAQPAVTTRKGERHLVRVDWSGQGEVVTSLVVPPPDTPISGSTVVYSATGPQWASYQIPRVGAGGVLLETAITEPGLDRGLHGPGYFAVDGGQIMTLLVPGMTVSLDGKNYILQSAQLTKVSRDGRYAIFGIDIDDEAKFYRWLRVELPRPV